MSLSISDRIAASLDPSDGTPLYHQLASVVRWEIEHGRLPIGSTLPPVREIAARAEINYHTVRRAWTVLEREGVIDLRRGRGARVIRAPKRGGWSPAGPAPERTTHTPRVWVVASSVESAAQLSRPLGEGWQVEPIPWPMEADAPPPGAILCEPAALERVRGRWSNREGDFRPIATALDPATVGVLRRNAALLGVTRVLIHGDPSAGPVRELLRQLPRLGLQAALAQDSNTGTAAGADLDALWLYFPEEWAELDWSGQTHPRAMAAHFGWAAGPLAGVAREQGWVAR